MKRVYEEPGWPDSWKYSYVYDLEEVYNQISHRGYAYAYANRVDETIKLITEVLPIGSKLLDVAGAQGNFSLRLAEAGYDVTWNDLRDELAGYVELKRERGNITFAPGNVFDLGFSEEFDLVLITEIIEHVAHPDEFLLKVSQMVKPGGYVVMTTPNGEFFRNRLPKFSDCSDPSMFESEQFKPNSDGHIFLLHSDEIRTLATAAGLTIDRLNLFTNPLTNGYMKTEIFLKVLPRRLIHSIERASQRLPQRMKSRGLVQMGARFLKPARSD